SGVMSEQHLQRHLSSGVNVARAINPAERPFTESAHDRVLIDQMVDERIATLGDEARSVLHAPAELGVICSAADRARKHAIENCIAHAVEQIVTLVRNASVL